MNKKFWAATFTLSGGTIGAGILGLPYIFSKSGWLSGLFWTIVLGLIMLYINLVFGEITLRTKGIHQISGYANIYLGKWGKRAGIFVMIFGIYSALLAYLIAEGESLSSIIPGNYNPMIFGIIFWIILTFLLTKGLNELKKVGTYGVSAIIIIVLLIFFSYLPKIGIENLANIGNGKEFFAPIGIILFALLGFTSIPEVKEEIKGQERLLKKAIIIGTIIPILAYILFTASFVGALGGNISEVATLSSGLAIKILGIFTMFTSYFILSFCLKRMYDFDLKIKKSYNFLLTSIMPLVLYLLIAHFNLLGFSSILGIGGVISAGLTGSLILIMAEKSKKFGNPSYKMFKGKWIVAVLSTIFIIGIILELFIKHS